MNGIPDHSASEVHDHPLEAHDHGLQSDMRRLGLDLAATQSSVLQRFDRRDLLRGAVVLSVGGAFSLLARRTRADAAAASCADIPEETAGPFPGDGTNGPNVLTSTGVVRRDMTSSFGSMSGKAGGVALTLTLTITDSTKCAPAKGHAVYLWHADREGRYSLYSDGVTNQNYLRAVQETDADGKVTFTTVFPGCYDGRWPHMHFEVYPNLNAARDASKRIATSQVAFPKSACDSVYATTGYSASIANLARLTLASDGIFGEDGGARQLAAMGGTVANGLTGSLTVPVSSSVKASGGGFGGPGPGGPGGPGAPARGGLGDLLPASSAAPATKVSSTKVATAKASATKSKATKKTTKS